MSKLENSDTKTKAVMWRRMIGIGVFTLLGCSSSVLGSRDPTAEKAASANSGSLLPAEERHPVVIAARKIAALNYQHCGGFELEAMASDAPEVEGIAIIGTHPNKIGKQRKVKNLEKVLSTHFYHKQYRGKRLDLACFSGVNLDKTPTIYNYGGKPAFVRDPEILRSYHAHQKLPEPEDGYFRPRIDVLRVGGSGVPGQLGIDCSGFVMASFALAGLRVRKAAPEGANDPLHALASDRMFHSTGGKKGRRLDERIETLEQFFDFQLRDNNAGGGRLKRIFQSMFHAVDNPALEKPKEKLVEAPVEVKPELELVPEPDEPVAEEPPTNPAKVAFDREAVAHRGEFSDTSARAFMNGASWGLTCFQAPRIGREVPVRAGDVIANAGHVVLVSRASADPFGMAKIRESAKASIDKWREEGGADIDEFHKKLVDHHCVIGAINHKTWDFDVVHSAPVGGGVGVNQMKISEYLDTGGFESLKGVASRICIYEIGTLIRQEDKSALEAWRASYAVAKPEHTTKTKEIAIQRHILTPDCRGERLRAIHEECFTKCQLPK